MVSHAQSSPLIAKTPLPRARTLRSAVPVGRVLFAAIFLISGLSHFSSGAIGYAASQGVPAAGLIVPLSGILAFLGGLSIVFGYKTRYGAAAIALFLIPVTFMMHRFWDMADPQMAAVQQAAFMKNLGLLGGALLLLYFGGGPYSLDARPRTGSKDER